MKEQTYLSWLRRLDVVYKQFIGNCLSGDWLCALLRTWAEQESRLFQDRRLQPGLFSKLSSHGNFSERREWLNKAAARVLCSLDSFIYYLLVNFKSPKTIHVRQWYTTAKQVPHGSGNPCSNSGHRSLIAIRGRRQNSLYLEVLIVFSYSRTIRKIIESWLTDGRCLRVWVNLITALTSATLLCFP